MAPKIVIRNLDYIYQGNTPFANQALYDISSVIPSGSFTMIIGATGSGKSTLLQQFDALLHPTSGIMKIGNIEWGTHVSREKIRSIRRKVGIVFQMPSKQLFDDTVKDDLLFGPRNFHFPLHQSQQNVHDILKLLNIPNSMLFKSPFDLSGGQMKKIAIAGVLVCHPQILLLDEPTVGLDKISAIHLMRLINQLRLRHHLTIIMITHEMAWVAEYATQVLVLKHGNLMANVSPLQLFQDRQLTLKAGLTLPFAAHFFCRLNQHGFRLKSMPLDKKALANEIVRKLRMKD